MKQRGEYERNAKERGSLAELIRLKSFIKVVVYRKGTEGENGSEEVGAAYEECERRYRCDERPVWQSTGKLSNYMNQIPVRKCYSIGLEKH